MIYSAGFLLTGYTSQYYFPWGRYIVFILIDSSDLSDYYKKYIFLKSYFLTVYFNFSAMSWISCILNSNFKKLDFNYLELCLNVNFIISYIKDCTTSKTNFYNLIHTYYFRTIQSMYRHIFKIKIRNRPQNIGFSNKNDHMRPRK